MKVLLAGVVHEGRAVDLPAGAPDSAALARAIGGCSDAAVRIECSRPGPGHELLWRPASPQTSVRGLLAAAARSRGENAPEQGELDAVRAEIASTTVTPVDTATRRREAAEAGQEVDRLRERVATARGELHARRETGAATADAEAALGAAIARLSEAETERIAARQKLAAAERRERANRDRRQRRLRLEDRADNLARTVRRSLAVRIHDEFAAALEAVPGEGAAGDRPSTYEGDPVTAALAACRLASLDAPVLDETGRFAAAADAAACLDVPVLRR